MATPARNLPALMPDILTTALAQPGLVWLGLAVCLAGLVRGFSGFGSALIIMPVASSVLTPVGAIVFLTVTEVFGPLPNLPDALKTGNRREILRLGVGVLIGLPLGIFGLTLMAPKVFGWVVSLTVLTLLVPLMLGWRYRGTLTPSLVMSTGALGGVFSGSVGLAGPPVIMMYMASKLPIAVIRANLLLYLVMIDIAMLISFGALGLMTAGPVVLGALMALPYAAANIIGARLFRPESEGVFRAVAYGIIAAIAIIGLPVWR